MFSTFNNKNKFNETPHRICIILGGYNYGTTGGFLSLFFIVKSTSAPTFMSLLYINTKNPCTFKVSDKAYREHVNLLQVSPLKLKKHDASNLATNN